MIQNQTWYIVHWTNLVHRFFSKVQVHLGQSFVFFAFQSSELFTLFHSSKIIVRGRSIIKSSSVVVPADVVSVKAVMIHVVVQGVVDDVVAGWSLDLRQISAARS